MNRRAFIVSSVAMSMLATKRVDASERCDEGILKSIESSGLTVVESAEVFGCHRNQFAGFESGIVKTSEHDFVFEAIGDEAKTLIRSIDRMSMDDRFYYSLRFDRTASEIITIGPYNRESKKYIGDESIMYSASWLHNVRRSYFDHFETYALANRTTEPALWSYMEWFMLRRDSTLDVLSSNMNPMAATGFKDRHGFGYLPWPWQITFSSSMKSYLSEQSASSKIISYGTTQLSQK